MILVVDHYLSHNMEQDKTLKEVLKTTNPVLLAVLLYNEKFLADMNHGVIHIIQHVKDGKIYRIEAIPKYSQLV